jgi:hypothetical protein
MFKEFNKIERKKVFFLHLVNVQIKQFEKLAWQFHTCFCHVRHEYIHFHPIVYLDAEKKSFKNYLFSTYQYYSYKSKKVLRNRIFRIRQVATTNKEGYWIYI